MDPGTLSGVLLVYGPLGLMALVSMLIAIKLYKDREADRVKHDEAIKALRAEMAEERERAKADMEKFQERHIVKAESWMEKYWEISKAQTAVLESFSKRTQDGPTRRDRTQGG